MNLNRPRALQPFAHVILVPVCALLLLGAVGAGLADGTPTPRVTSVTLVTGAVDTYNPDTLIANLDGSAMVAGITQMVREPGGPMNPDARVGFFWTPGEGGRDFSPDDLNLGNRVFHDDLDWYWKWNRVQSVDISDAGAVVGMHLFYDGFFPVYFPFFWSAADGFHFLPMTCTNFGGPGLDTFGGDLCIGSAFAISADGGTIVGTVWDDTTFMNPEKAARWRVTRTETGLKFELRVLSGSEPWSRAWDVSANGLVIVGEAGYDEMVQDAARWIGGVRQRLQPVGSSSLARFTSRDGNVAIGSATIGEQTVLVRWDRAGVATIAAPPNGMSVESIQAINPAGTAAVGALSPGGFLGNWVPFLWTAADGFTLIPELGHEMEFDASEAMDLSDDGAWVVGQLSTRFAGPGSLGPVSFLWNRATGTTLEIRELLADAGYPPLDLYFAPFISGDGLRILAKGNPDFTEHDTNTVLIGLSR